MCFVGFTGTSLSVFKFVHIKEGGSNFWGKAIFENVWIIWSRLLYLDFKSSFYLDSSLFIRFQSILYHSGVPLSGFSNFQKLKRGDLTSGGNQFSRMSELFGPPILYFQIKSFLDPNSAPFCRFRCILFYSGVILWGFSNLYKLKRDDPISEGNQFCTMSELFGLPFGISILKVLWT